MTLEGPIMASIQIFDPALCCSTGVCGVEVDQALVSFAADVDWAKQGGAQVERFNLAQQPLAFAENATVKAFLERSGQEALPLILVDGEVALAGRYPNRTELARWAGISAPSAPQSQGACCSGSRCC
jgi:thiamine pyrophosphate-dependent acetolactate synthase large subunit-like protein